MSLQNHYICYIEAINSRRRAEYERLEHQARTKIVHCHNIPAEILIGILDLCPVGEGILYEHFVLDALGIAFAGIVDSKNVVMHSPSQGGYNDIEFPFCPEMLHQYPFWEPWFYRYEIKSIIAEAKNMEDKASLEDVRQMKDYLDGSKKGRYGTLVSRNGFTRSAMKRLRAYADDSDTLILPITHQDLKTLLRLSVSSPLDAIRFLYRQETLLLRVR